eukprot:7952523-Alexandrium_andersonii.AAC.1
MGFPKLYFEGLDLTEDQKCELVGDSFAVNVIVRILASADGLDGIWPPLPLKLDEGRVVACPAGDLPFVGPEPAVP